MNVMNTTKKRVGTIILCGTLMLVGTSAAFAVNAAESKNAKANLVKMEDGVASYSTDDGATWNESLNKDSYTRYSLDDGLTWKEGLPPEGSGEKSLITHGTIPPTDSNGDKLMTKNENGVMSWSMDDGQTWSENIPDGFSATENPDGSVSVKRQ